MSELNACRDIRRIVFVDEQGVAPDLEYDSLDRTATHYLACRQGRPVACARAIRDAGCVVVGRVAVLKADRGAGVGSALMTAVLEDAARGGAAFALLHAQVRALGFYEKLGFAAEGDEFLEADIPHYTMRKELR